MRGQTRNLGRNAVAFFFSVFALNAVVGPETAVPRRVASLILAADEVLVEITSPLSGHRPRRSPPRRRETGARSPPRSSLPTGPAARCTGG